MRDLKLPAVFLASLIALTGCASSTPEPTPTASATSSPTVEPKPEPVYVAAPLTGVEYLEGENLFLEMPAVSAK